MKNEPKLIIHISLPENFVGVVHDTMEEEFETASKKWGVQLNQQTQNDILTHAIRQTRMKVSDTTRSTWDLSDSLTVFAKSPKKSLELSLPHEEAKKSKISLIYTREGWIVDQEHNDDSVALGDFYDHIYNSILTWARTAVFYGVGSYAQ